MIVWNQVARNMQRAALVTPTLAGGIAVLQSYALLGLCTAVLYPSSNTFLKWNATHTTAQEVGTVLLRTLIVPSLVEETVWRIMLQPPGTSLFQIVATNAAFAAYHVVSANILVTFLDQKMGAPEVFRQPSFLALAFVLGNVCSFAYCRSGHALWAPVVVHALPVTLWLTVCSGMEALRTPGGLPPSKDD